MKMMKNRVIFGKARRIPQGRSEFLDHYVEIILCCKNHPEKYLVINITQICYCALLLSFTRECQRVMKNRFKIHVLVLVYLFFGYILAYLVITFHDPMEFGKTISTTGTTFIALMRALCKPSRTPNIVNEVVLFATGAAWTLSGLISSDLFILIPNLVGALAGSGLVLIVENVKEAQYCL